MHDDSFLPWALDGNSACIVVPLPQRFREHSWLLPQLFPRSALAWKTRSASIDTNETSKELLVFSHNHRKKSCSTAGSCFFLRHLPCHFSKPLVVANCSTRAFT